MKKTFIYIFLSFSWISILFGTGTRGLKIDFSIIGKQNNPAIVLTSNNLCTPLEIIPIAEENKGTFYFRTNDGRHWVRGDPDLKILNHRGHELSWNLEKRKVSLIIKKDKSDFLVEMKASPDDDILGWGLNIKADKNEYFTGLFERTIDGEDEKSWIPELSEPMNLRDRQIEMLIKHTISLYSPFYISSKGYGMHVYGTWPGKYDMGKEFDDFIQIYFDGPDFNCKIYTGKNPAEIIKAHTLETGPPLVPPKWAFSHWRWRGEHTNKNQYFDGSHVKAPYNSMVVEDILMMDALDIPCGVYWIDRPWAKGDFGYDDFEWDPERFPNPNKMINWLDNRDKKMLLWIAPWVSGDMASYSIQHNYNFAYQKAHKNDRPLIDFTNPEAVKWWQEEGPIKLLNQGIKGFKLDRSEELVPESREQYVFDGRSYRELRNTYPVEYVKATYEAAQKVYGKDFVLLPRAGYTGSSKYGVFWGGDIGSPQEGLRCAIVALLRSSVIGYPFWGSDIGGYWGGKLNREVTARWLAFGCFCPIMEVGPTEDKGLWKLNSEPHYDPRVLAIWRLYAKLHTKLMDYTYKYAKIAHNSGMPIARPIFMVCPEKQEAWQDWQTYLYGKDILVSPIWRKGKRLHKLYLPDGNTWIDAWDPGQEYEGGQKISVNVELYKIPIFIRKGSRVDLGNLYKLFQESLEIVKNKPDMKQLEKEADFSTN